MNWVSAQNKTKPIWNVFFSAVSKEITEIVIQLILIIFYTIFLSVLYRCYQFVREKKNHTMQYAAQLEMETCAS